MAYRTCDDDILTPPLSPWQYLSIFICQLLAVDPDEVTVILLHKRL